MPAVGFVVIAENHRDEFVSVADYLNDAASYDPETTIQVSLVRVRAVRRVGDEVCSPEFVVQTQPNEWESTIRRDTAPRLSSLDEFYDRCAESAGSEWAGDARTIIEEWLLHPGATEDHNTKQTVALYLPKPNDPSRRTNVMQLGLNGSLTICRGYLWETSGAFDPEVEPDDLDQRIRHDFPDAKWPPQKYFVAQIRTTPQQASSFGAWIRTRFAD